MLSSFTEQAFARIMQSAPANAVALGHTWCTAGLYVSKLSFLKITKDCVPLREQ